MTTNTRVNVRTRQRWNLLALIFVAPASFFGGFFLVVSLSGGVNRLLASFASPPDASETSTDASVIQSKDGGSQISGEPRDDDSHIEGLQIRPALPVTMGEPFYFRCWETGNDEPMTGESCGVLTLFERLVASRLGVVAKCYERLDVADSQGELSLAVDVDFTGIEEEKGEGSVRFWAGKSTTIPQAEAVINCVRHRVDKLPLQGMNPKNERYTIFFPISFRTESEKGRSVEIILDKVRLREQPVKGRTITLLRQGEPVRLYKVESEWAKVRTVDGKDGWVFTEAITVPEL